MMLARFWFPAFEFVIPIFKAQNVELSESSLGGFSTIPVSSPLLGESVSELTPPKKTISIELHHLP